MGAGTVMICLKPWGHFELSRNEIIAVVFVFNLEPCFTESASPNMWDFILIKPALPQTIMLEPAFAAGHSFLLLQGLCSDHRPSSTYSCIDIKKIEIIIKKILNPIYPRYLLSNRWVNTGYSLCTQFLDKFQRGFSGLSEQMYGNATPGKPAMTRTIHTPVY